MARFRRARWLHRALVGALGLVLIAAGRQGACAQANAPRPNIVLILADDLGYADLSCYGQKNFTTPHLDALAAEGLRFTQHYAGSSVCAPSRACLLSGLHTGHVYQRANGQIAFRPDPQDISIARLLKDAGYHTAMIGKSGLSGRTPNARHPNEKGFDHFFGFVSHGEAHRYYPQALLRNGAPVTYPANHGFEGEQYSGDLFLAEALAYLDERAAASARRPFFLHLAFQQPHADLVAPPAWRDRFVGKFQETPFPGNAYRAESHPKATYAAMVTCLDDAVGQVRARLETLGLAENTLVVFSSDNGAMSEGGWSRDNFNSSGPLRGGKRDLYEGGLRVPLIAWWPGRIAAGQITNHVSAFWDFVPTACELAGTPAPPDSDGLSYVPALLARGVQPQHEHLYWELHEQGGKQAVRRGPWKLVRLDALDPARQRAELYNLERDPAEEHDVAADYPAVVAELAAIMNGQHVEQPPFVLPDLATREMEAGAPLPGAAKP